MTKPPVTQQYNAWHRKKENDDSDVEGEGDRQYPCLGFLSQWQGWSIWQEHSVSCPLLGLFFVLISFCFVSCGLNCELVDAMACTLQIWCDQMHLWPSLMWFTSWNINIPFIVVLNAVVLSDGHLMSVVIEACDIWHQIQCKYWRSTRSLSPVLSLSLYYLLHRICWKESGQ